MTKLDGLSSRDWRERLQVSRDIGTGFAAPGKELTQPLNGVCYQVVLFCIN